MRHPASRTGWECRGTRRRARRRERAPQEVRIELAHAGAGVRVEALIGDFEKVTFDTRVALR